MAESSIDPGPDVVSLTSRREKKIICDRSMQVINFLQDFAKCC